MDDNPRTGLRLRCEKGVSPEVRMVYIKFCKWLPTPKLMADLLVQASSTL